MHRAEQAAHDEGRYNVTLIRDDKRIVIVMRGDDYSASVRITRGNGARMKYGTGRMWSVVDVSVTEVQ